MKTRVPTPAPAKAAPAKPAADPVVSEPPGKSLRDIPVHSPVEAARDGVGGAAQPLPFRERIQESFGRHSLRDVQAVVGGAASQASDRLDAHAFAVGDRVGFRETPDLWLAAHEAAHVVQQRAPAGAEASPGAERRADLVADQVARGASAEWMLGPVEARTPGGSPGSIVQLRARAGHKVGTIKIGWNDDSVEFFHRITEATAKKFHVDESGLFQNFLAPAQRAYRALASTSPRGSVKLDIEFDYNPDDANDVTGTSNVSIRLHVESAKTAVVVSPKAAEKSKAAEVEPVVDDDHPPANETLEQRFARQARQTTRVLSRDVADADRDGYSRIEIIVESDGKEISPSSMQKLDRHDRPKGVPLVSAATVASQHIGPLLDFVAGSAGKPWRYALVFKRGAGGAMEFSSWKGFDVALPSTGTAMSDNDMLAAEGIPDRKAIYGDIFKKAEKEIKASAVQLATFGVEQIVLWIVGGWIFKGLGLFAEATFPRLAAALRAGGSAELNGALKALEAGEGEELAAIMAKLEQGGELTATETAQLSKIYATVESGLGRTITFTKEMVSSRRIIAEGRDIRKVEQLVERFGGKAAKWKKYATTDAATGLEVHWYECDGVGKVGVKFEGEFDPF